MINACFLARFDNSTIHMTHSSNFYSMKCMLKKSSIFFFYSSFSCILYWCNIKTYITKTQHIPKNTILSILNSLGLKVRLLTPDGYFWCFCFLYFRHLLSNASRSIMMNLHSYTDWFLWEWFFGRIFDSILQLSYR